MLDFVRLAQAFFAELEARFVGWWGERAGGPGAG